jgi:glycerate 2-kinase
VLAIVGDIGDDIDGIYETGISTVFSINRKAVPFETAKQSCRLDLLKTVESVMRFINSIGC